MSTSETLPKTEISKLDYNYNQFWTIIDNVTRKENEVKISYFF
jgi:hypothetical protein